MNKKLNRQELSILTKAEKIDYFCHQSDLISINNGNQKTGIGCLTMSMPVITCREDAPCRKNCYCMKGHQQYATAQGAYYRNYRIWTENPTRFEEQLEGILKYSNISMFRYNDCGEIPDKKFLAMMFRIALQFPQISFLAYTKKYELINEFLDEGNIIPQNLTIRFSMWDKHWKVDNPYNLPVAYVEFKDENLNPKLPTKSFVCPGTGKITCSCCKVCWQKKVKSVTFHQH